MCSALGISHGDHKHKRLLHIHKDKEQNCKYRVNSLLYLVVVWLVRPVSAVCSLIVSTSSFVKQEFTPYSEYCRSFSEIWLCMLLSSNRGLEAKSL